MNKITEEQIDKIIELQTNSYRTLPAFQGGTWEEAQAYIQKYDTSYQNFKVVKG